MWTGLTWITMPFLALKFGFLGVSYAVAIIATSSLVTILLARKYVDFNLLNILKTPLFATLSMSLFLSVFIRYGTSVFNLVTIGIFSATIYFSSVILIEGISFFTNTLNYFKIKHV